MARGGSGDGPTMDETDFRILNVLIQDSRTPYSALARRLRLSVPAVHKRVASLQETGVITKFTASLSVAFLRAVTVYVSGVSQIFPVQRAVENLREDDRPSIVITGSGNSIYVRAFLRTIHELEPFVAFVRRAAGIVSPVIAIEGLSLYGTSPPLRAASEAAELEPMDARILRSLHDDARKPLANVCQELGLSPKTVRNRLRRLVEGGVAEFSLAIQLGEQAGVNSFLTIQLRPDADAPAFRGRLLRDLGVRSLWSMSASNVPDALTVQSWSPTSIAHEELVARVNAYEGVERVGVHVLSHYDFLETWRDVLLEQRARSTARS